MSSMVITQKISRPAIDFLLPFFILSVVAIFVPVLHFVFNVNTRWIIFLICLFYFVMNIKLIQFMDAWFFVFLFAYVLWCFFTSFWSQLPMFSLGKTSLLFAVVFMMISMGIEWVRVHVWSKALDFLGLISIGVLSLAVVGKLHGCGDVQAAAGYIGFRGLFSNSNSFGGILIMCFPFLLWKAFSSTHRRKIWIMATIGTMYFVFLSLSRTAIMMMAIIMMFFLINLNLKSKLKTGGVILLLGLFAILSNPDTSILNKYIYKYDVNHNIFASRKNNWQESIEGAKEGGWFGLGYGTSLGKTNFQFQYGLTSMGSGREKGNSQLAILEETGITGLVLYLIIIFMIFVKLVKVYFSAANSNQKMLIGLITGAVLAQLVCSMLEAWWDAPMSIEAIYFWLLIGVIRGLEVRFNQQKSSS